MGLFFYQTVNFAGADLSLSRPPIARKCGRPPPLRDELALFTQETLSYKRTQPVRPARAKANQGRNANRGRS
ncbi:hypothetical protein [Cereibacter changlensis]|uniref:hypothetical protein n=1 Tax=Cereibacter changlensis TaxID=402884 RepID=UPI00403355CE